MALTSDEKKGILELRGRFYSYRKIAHETGHSETTVRKVIGEAEERVVSLRGEGLERNQIVKQLDYLLVFVSNVTYKASILKAEVIPAEAEIKQPPWRPDFQADWDEFKRHQALEIAKEELQERVNDLMEDLEEGERQLNDKQIGAVAWRKRKKAFALRQSAVSCRSGGCSRHASYTQYFHTSQAYSIHGRKFSMLDSNMG